MLSHKESDHVPWHRALSYKGEVKSILRSEAQKKKLESEGLTFTQNRVDNLRVCISSIKTLVSWKPKHTRCKPLA